MLGLSIGGGNEPPPPEEKKDPNVTGLAAKVVASKKRKEAMKDTIEIKERSFRIHLK